LAAREKKYRSAHFTLQALYDQTGYDSTTGGLFPDHDLFLVRLMHIRYAEDVRLEYELHVATKRHDDALEMAIAERRASELITKATKAMGLSHQHAVEAYKSSKPGTYYATSTWGQFKGSIVSDIAGGGMYDCLNLPVPTPTYTLMNSIELGICWREVHFNTLKSMQLKQKRFPNKPDNLFLKSSPSLRSIFPKGEYSLKFFFKLENEFRLRISLLGGIVGNIFTDTAFHSMTFFYWIRCYTILPMSTLGKIRESVAQARVATERVEFFIFTRMIIIVTSFLLA
jgi:hypothetical protein